MRELHELVAGNETWLELRESARASRNSVSLWKAQPEKGASVLLHLQVSTRSPLGAMAYCSGGGSVDDGWIRLLGSGHPEIAGDLASWNPDPRPYLLVAYDLVGGFFAINGGALEAAPGEVCYFAPDRLLWEASGLRHGEWMQWLFQADLEAYYEGLRWPEWRAEAARLPTAKAWLHYPFLWSKAEERSRKPVPVSELWNLQLEMARQLK